jgi:GT2 family glycosyltransferase
MTFKVVIPSARAANLVPCVRALMAYDPEITPQRIIVVDDGARAEAESELPPVTWLSGIKPFVFARNANLGLAAAGSDAVLLNDDAQLITPYGFTLLGGLLQAHPELGICSAAIRGLVGNANQLAVGRTELRLEARSLAFVCVYIPRSTFERVGLLDERFVGYGFEDNDYSWRVRAIGLSLGIWDGCAVDHSGDLPSTFRSRSDCQALMRQNEQIFHTKWQRSAWS